MRKIRVLVADGETMYRESICAVLKERQDVEIVGRATGVKDAIQMVRERRPQVVLMEPGEDDLGLEQVVGLLRNGESNVKILLVSQHEDEQHILSGLRSGCEGYIPKRATASELISAILALSRGGYYLYPSVAKVVINECVSKFREMQTHAPKEVCANGRKCV